MKITAAQMDAQYKVAIKYAGSLMDEVEKEFDLPPFSMYAIGSRETNFDPYYIDHAGDYGNGHGWWQVDKRYHEIPDDWASDIEWQCYKGGEIFADCLEAADEDIIAAFNRYNSGQELTSKTTGKDYGPDVESRRQYLLNKYGKVEEEFVAMQSLVSLRSGYAIDVTGGSKEDRAGIQQYRCNGTKAQSILFEEVGTHTDGRKVYCLKFEHSGKYLDNDPNRLEVVQFSRADVHGQLWFVNQLPNGAFTIQSFADGRVLDVEGNSDKEGARIIAYEWLNAPNQMWAKVNFR